jgi:hypothetical protein
MLITKVNIGFRHFLPPYAFMLMLGSRCLVNASRAWSVLAWSAIATVGIHALSYHPDYLCYINSPRSKPYLAISDSNVDWGQALKQINIWLDAHPQKARPVALHYFGSEDGCVNYYLNDRVVPIDLHSARPTNGLLLISPVCVAGVYDNSDLYAALRSREPDDVIGNSILVFDLDRLGHGSPFQWPPPMGWPASSTH